MDWINEHVNLTFFFIERHPFYSLVGVLLVLALWLIGRYRFRITVPPNQLLFFNDEILVKEPGRHFMPYAYRLVDMRLQEFPLNLDDLSPSQRVDTYRGGIIQPDSVVTSSPGGRKEPPVVVRWKPDRWKLGDYVNNPASVTDFQKAVRHYFKLNPPQSRTATEHTYALRRWIKDIHCGIEVEWAYVGGGSKASGQAVSLADNVEIPYEG
jgi:hypothetical protein